MLQALPPLQGGTRPAPYFLPPQAGAGSPQAAPNLVQVRCSPFYGICDQHMSSRCITWRSSSSVSICV